MMNVALVGQEMQNYRWEYKPLSEVAEIHDTRRKPINAKERAKRIEGKDETSLFPYYGATGQVGYIDDYLTDGEYVLLGEDGAPFLDAFASKAYIITGKAWVNNHAHILRSKGDNRFLCYYLNHFDFHDYVSGTTRLKLTQEQMKRIPVPVLPIEEQQRIVARIEELFSQLDDAEATLQKTKAQLAVYRQAVLKEAFEAVDGKPGILGSYIVEKPRNGYSPKPVNFETKYKNLTLTATTGGIFKPGYYKYIDCEIGDDSHLWVKHNDILIQRANTIDYVGTAALYLGEDNEYVYPDLMMKCHTIESVLPKYILFQLHYQRIIGYYRKHATGTAGSMPKVNQATVCNTPIIMTTKEKQIGVVKSIESCLSFCDSIEQTVYTALQLSEALRQSFLKDAFEGRL